MKELQVTEVLAKIKLLKGMLSRVRYLRKTSFLQPTRPEIILTFVFYLNVHLCFISMFLKCRKPSVYP